MINPGFTMDALPIALTLFRFFTQPDGAVPVDELYEPKGGCRKHEQTEQWEVRIHRCLAKSM